MQKPAVAQNHLDNRRASRFARYRPYGMGTLRRMIFCSTLLDESGNPCPAKSIFPPSEHNATFVKGDAAES
jgi:hypothetical protein